MPLLCASGYFNRRAPTISRLSDYSIDRETDRARIFTNHQYVEGSRPLVIHIKDS